MADAPTPRALVLIPTYKERENLPIAVAGALAHDGIRVLVLDDGSPDGTGAVADALAAAHPGRVAVLHRTGPRGLGRAYLDGMRAALETDADVVCQMDADLSHDPQYLPALLAASATHDLVIGSRYMRGVSVVNWPLRRILLSMSANSYVRFVLRLTVRDCTAGFRCFRRALLARLPLDRVTSEGYAFQVEMLALAHAAGARIAEVPIIFVERREGASKMSARVMLESLVMPWRLLLRRATGRLRPAASGYNPH